MYFHHYLTLSEPNIRHCIKIEGKVLKQDKRHFFNVARIFGIVVYNVYLLSDKFSVNNIFVYWFHLQEIYFFIRRQNHRSVHSSLV